MKVYILYELYYDYCDQWDNILDIYDSEDKAVMAQIEEESKPQYKNKEQYSTSIEEREVK